MKRPCRNWKVGPLLYMVAGAVAAAAITLSVRPINVRATISREAQLAVDFGSLFSGVAESVKRSVVSVSVETKVEENLGEPAPERAPLSSSVGSGFVIDRRGYILTNYHLIAPGGKIVIKTHEHTEYPATLVQADSPSDIALVKITTRGDLPSLSLGDSEGVRVGHWVLAIGSPFGLTQTVSAGIVSAVRRSDLNILPFESFIQTDASINPGNSGGPLVNLRGEAIGINTAIFSSPSGGNQGIGFAVPISLAKALVERWIRGESISYLGVATRRVNADAARYFGLKEARGVFVATVAPLSPSAAAGLQERDVLLAFNDQPIRDENHLRLLLAQTNPGSQVELSILRSGQQQNVTVALTARNWNEAPPISEKQRSRAGVLGLSVIPVTAQSAQTAGLPADARGVLVLRVQPGSPASHRGVREGDVILEINEKPVHTIGEIRSALEVSPEIVLLYLARRGQQNLYLFLPL
jgi:serine protease Do